MTTKHRALAWALHRRRKWRSTRAFDRTAAENRWEQVEDVVSRDLAPYGLRFGQRYRLVCDRIPRR